MRDQPAPTATKSPAARVVSECPDEVLRQAAQGDASAWRVLVETYSRRVFGLVLRQTGDRDLSEEITQATFVKVVHKMGKAGRGYEERGRFEAWLFRIAMNQLRDEMRRRKRQAQPMDMSPAATAGREGASGWAAAQQTVVQGGPAPGEDPGAIADRTEQMQLLQELVLTLSEADRQILHLRHTAGLSFPQIAETLGEPLGTVLARGHRALKKLRKMMDDAQDVKRPTGR